MGYVPTLMACAKDAEYALTGIIENEFDEDEYGSSKQPCDPFEDLCGHRLCNAVGCLKLKRDELRTAIGHNVK